MQFTVNSNSQKQFCETSRQAVHTSGIKGRQSYTNIPGTPRASIAARTLVTFQQMPTQAFIASKSLDGQRIVLQCLLGRMLAQSFWIAASRNAPEGSVSGRTAGLHLLRLPPENGAGLSPRSLLMLAWPRITPPHIC